MVMAPASCESVFETDFVSEPDLDGAFFITKKLEGGINMKKINLENVRGDYFGST